MKKCIRVRRAGVPVTPPSPPQTSSVGVTYTRDEAWGVVADMILLAIKKRKGV